MSVKLVRIPVHQATVLLCNTRHDTVSAIRATIKDKAEQDRNIAILNSSDAFSTEGDVPHRLQIIYSKRKPSDLCHEVVHIGVRVLSRLGIKITPKHDEPLAYLVDHLVDEYYKKSGWTKYDASVLEEAV